MTTMRSLSVSILFLSLVSCGQITMVDVQYPTPTILTANPPIITDQDKLLPTTYATLTPEPLKSKSTSTPAIQQSQTIASDQIEGSLYLWITGGLIFPTYSSIDLIEIGSHPTLFDKLSPDLMYTNGRKVITLAFAPYSPLIAFLTLTEDTIDLWLADINLQDTELVWSNDSQWFGQISNSGDGYIRWGPGERSIILTSYLAKEKIVIYSLETQEVIAGKGSCDRIAHQPESNQLSIWCEFIDGTKLPYGVLASDGKVKFYDTLPDNHIKTTEWSFAPDNQRMIYATKSGDLEIVDQNDERLVLSARLLNGPREYRTVPYLQWSQSGDQLLVYAFNKKYCPSWEDPGFGTIIEKECWLILDTKTGEFLWWPIRGESSIQTITGLPLSKLASTCAGLSPDAKWISLCFHSGAINYFLSISIENNDIVDFGTIQVQSFKWLHK